jgi:methyl-accepting chemotaxis protein
MLSTISIRAKIISVVAFLLVAMAGMGLLAVMKMRAINANTVDITTNWMPSVRVLGDLRAAVITYRNVVREHMLAETLDEKLASEETAVTVTETLVKARKSYEAMIASPEERALYTEWSKLWADYQRGVEEVMDKSRMEFGKVPHQAHELNSKTVNKVGLKSDEVLQKAIELNNIGGNRAAADAADTYDYAFVLVAIILGAAILSGLGVGFYLVRDVSSGIDSITQPMQALGRGDLAAEVPHRGEKT